MRFTRNIVSSAMLTALTGSGQALAATPVFINELHYDNAGTDNGEFIEVAGPAGTDLNGWSIVLYNGSASVRAPYNTLALSGVLNDDTGSGYGFQALILPSNGVQNGSPDGLALVDAAGNLMQFLSYEGSFAAASGPAAGVTSSDIGVSESGSTRVGSALQLQGDGSRYEDYGWTDGGSATPGAINPGQTFNGSGSEGPAHPGPAEVPIYDLQGRGHVSPFVGQSVLTKGIVTAVDSNAFFIQDSLGDGDPATADAIYVYTGSTPGVSVGDEASIQGTISEYIPGGAGSGNLSTTEFYRPTVTVLSSGNGLPAPVVIGQAGRLPPNRIIDNDGLTRFDPAEDGIDFYESLEAMRVTLADAVAVSPTNHFGEIFALADQGAGATGRNLRGGITISADDYNPERVQINVDAGILPAFSVVANTGDTLGDVTGVIGYSYGNFEIYPTETFELIPAGLTPEITTLTGHGRKQLTIASYNLLNLDPNDDDGDQDLADGRFEHIAAQIVDNLRSPAILGVQEIQDNSGSVDDGVVDADLTLQTLADAIAAAGGPQYAFIDNPPEDGQDGGQPGANIRVAFLYDPTRVDLVNGSVHKITDPDPSDGDAFANSRKPLAASFRIGRQTLHLVNNHFSSKSGSTPLFGTTQPPINGHQDARTAQAAIISAYVASLEKADPDVRVVVMGDLNEFAFMPPLKTLKGDPEPLLANLTETLLPTERYSYNYRGNAQALDHMLVSHNLASAARYDVVHVNSEFAEAASDHDPTLLQLDLKNKPAQLRVATFNASLNRSAAGQLIEDLSTPDNAQAKAVAEIIQRTRPDVILLNEFDYDPDSKGAALFLRNYLAVSQNGAKPIRYRHRFSAPVNTGVPSGQDLDNDGSIGGPNDAYGFGFYPGQYGMLVLSRYPIDTRRVRTFQHFLWRDMPNALLPDDPTTEAPADWYSDAELNVLRLSSKSHWDLPIQVHGRTLHLLASHPTPPVFDGEEDRNGRRNHDEIRFWSDYVGGSGDYIYDDRGRRGGLRDNAAFVIVGDMNADPQDGDSTGDPAIMLLGTPGVNTAITPVSRGGAEAALRQGGANINQQGGADFDTADFADGTPGNLRVDFVLPSDNLTLRRAGVFWPVQASPHSALTGEYPFPSSDHRLVWVDLDSRSAQPHEDRRQPPVHPHHKDVHEPHHPHR